jgi:molybdopterin-binding protein
MANDAGWPGSVGIVFGAARGCAMLYGFNGMVRGMERPKLYTARDAAQVLGVSYASLKQWIYQGKLKTVKTQGGHHRIPETEIDRLLPKKMSGDSVATRRKNFRRISGRNQLVGRVVDIKISGLMAQVTLSLGDQHITSIVTADAVRELRLKKGQIAAALIKSTEVMIVLP